MVPPKPVVGSCQDCQHYGWLAYRWLCTACQAWNRDHPRSDCAGCDRTDIAVLKRHCRGCWKQAAYLAGPLNTKTLLHETTRFPYQQLALAGIRRAKRGYHQPRPIRPRHAVATPAAVRGQLAMFPATGLRPVKAARAPAITPISQLRLHTFWTLEAVDEHGRSHGWSPALRARARETVINAINDGPAGARVTRRDLRVCGGPVTLLAPILAGLDLLDDPPVDPLAALIARRTTGLPAGMRGDLAAWITVLRDGGARSRPKTWKTVLEYSRCVLPLLHSWAASDHEQLREITADDVSRALAAIPAGSARHNTFVATRALFRFLHRDRRVFTNPAASCTLGTRHEPAVLPLTAQQYQRVAAAATTELHRVVLVLAAVHAARPHQIRGLLLDDLSVAGGQLTLAGVSRGLDDLSLRAFSEWLHYRRRTWPLTANRHLLISTANAATDTPVSCTLLHGLFRGTGVSLDRLRMDRHLEEALSYGPDPLHLSRMFGISTATGIRYTSQARQLLEPPEPAPQDDERATTSHTQPAGP